MNKLVRFTLIASTTLSLMACGESGIHASTVAKNKNINMTPSSIEKTDTSPKEEKCWFSRK